MTIQAFKVRNVVFGGIAVLAGCAKGDVGATRGGDTSGTETAATGKTAGDTSTSAGTDGATTVATSATTTGGSTTSPLSTSGTTAGECALPWRTPMQTATLYGSTFHDGVLYVVGQNESGTGHLAAVDPCDGAVMNAVQVGHATNPETVWMGVTGTTDGLFLAGWTSSGLGLKQGVYARLELGTLNTDWTVPVDGSVAKKDHFNKITELSTGRLWMVGKQGEGLTQLPWLGSGSALGQACGFTWGGQPGEGHVLIEGTDVVYAIVNRLENAVLLHFDPTCTCGCAPTFTSSAISIGAASTEVYDAVLIDGNLYVVGRAFDDLMNGNARAFIAALDAATGTITGQSTFDDGALIEAQLALATDGNALFVGGVTKWSGVGYYGGAVGHIWAYDLPLINGSQPLWDTDLTNIEAVVDVVRDPATGRLYLTATDSGSGIVIGCDENWTCE